MTEGAALMFTSAFPPNKFAPRALRLSLWQDHGESQVKNGVDNVQWRRVAMNTLTKFVLGMMGQLRPKPAIGNTIQSISLPLPEKRGGLPLMEALAMRLIPRFCTGSIVLAASFKSSLGNLWD